MRICRKSYQLPVFLVSGKTATGKAQLAYMKAEIDYRVAHAQLMQTLGQP